MERSPRGIVYQDHPPLTSPSPPPPSLPKGLSRNHFGGCAARFVKLLPIFNTIKLCEFIHQISGLTFNLCLSIFRLCSPTSHIAKASRRGVGGGGGRVLPYSLGGTCRWVRESPTLYQTKFCKFCDPVPD